MSKGPWKSKDATKPSVEDAVSTMTDAQKRALALTLLRDTDTDALEAIHIAEQEKATQIKLDMAERNEQAKQRNEPHFWIEINRMGPDDKEPDVFVGAGGVSYTIQKDIVVPVPQSVLDVLDNAIINSHVPIVDESLGVKYAKKVRFKRYPYSRLGPATKADVDRWHKEHEAKVQQAEGITIGQEVARASLVRDSIVNQEEPFIPAYLRGQEETPSE